MPGVGGGGGGHNGIRIGVRRGTEIQYVGIDLLR
jgi:hypothetical protein